MLSVAKEIIGALTILLFGAFDQIQTSNEKFEPEPQGRFAKNNIVLRKALLSGLLSPAFVSASADEVVHLKA